MRTRYTRELERQVDGWTYSCCWDREDLPESPKLPAYGDHFAESKEELDEQRKKFLEWLDAQGRTYAERERDIKCEKELG